MFKICTKTVLKVKLVRENAVTQAQGSCSLLVMGSCYCIFLKAMLSAIVHVCEDCLPRNARFLMIFCIACTCNDRFHLNA